MKVELITDVDCPNVEAARANLMRAFSRVGLPARWTEWERDDPEAPAWVAEYGSPTVLVDGRDVSGDGGSSPSGGNCCRVYDGEDGALTGVPPVELLVDALSEAASSPAPPESDTRLSGFAALPGLVAAFLPKVTCPLCWPAYAAALSAAGLGFLLDSAWLLPISGGLLALAVGSMAWRAPSRRGYGPALLGLVASAMVLTGKFLFLSDAATYGGTALLVGAAVWNLWPRRAADCSACRSEAPRLT